MEILCIGLMPLDQEAWNLTTKIPPRRFWLVEVFPRMNSMTPAGLSNSHWSLRTFGDIQTSYTQEWVPQCYRCSSGAKPFIKTLKPPEKCTLCKWIYYHRHWIQHGAAKKFKEPGQGPNLYQDFWDIQTHSSSPCFSSCLEVLARKIKNVEILPLYTTANKIFPREGLLDE